METRPPPASPAARPRRRLLPGRRSCLRLALLLGLIAATLYLADDRYGRPWRLRRDLLEKQRACLECPAPPGATLAVPLLWAASSEPGGGASGETAVPDAVVAAERAYAAFEAAHEALLRDRAGRTLPPLPDLGPPLPQTRAFDPWQGSTAPRSDRDVGRGHVVFLHGRRAGAGSERLVAVRLVPFQAVGPYGRGWEPRWTLSALVVCPAVGGGDPVSLNWAAATLPDSARVGEPIVIPDNARIAYGRPDPADPARFTIDVQPYPVTMPAYRLVYVGRLLPGNTVAWERIGPAPFRM